MANTTHIGPSYTYAAPDGTVYYGRVAYVLNALDSAEAALYYPTEDYYGNPIGPIGGPPAAVYEALQVLLDNHAILAQHL